MAAPRVLIVSWLRSVSSARLAAKLAKSGAEVSAVCPQFHPLRRIRAIGEALPYFSLRACASISRAIASFRPDFVVSCDDISTLRLQRMRQAARRSGDDVRVALLDRSLCADREIEIAMSRAALIAAAQAEGVRAPRTDVVGSQDELTRWIAAHGLPAFLKTDGSFGGIGVAEATSPEQARQAFELLQRPRLKSAAKWVVKHQIWSPLAQRLGGRANVVSAQSAIRGTPANCAASSWRGEILTIVTVGVEDATSDHGVSACVRVIENGEIEAAARAIARRLGMNGFFGLDFIIEEKTGHAWLIEMNIRPTRITHLEISPSPVTALIERLGGRQIPGERGEPAGRDLFHIFPSQLRGQGRSPHTASQLDVPWDEPDLIRSCAPPPRSLGDLVSELAGRYLL
jgi:hypothetical protein